MSDEMNTKTMMPETTLIANDDSAMPETVMVTPQQQVSVKASKNLSLLTEAPRVSSNNPPGPIRLKENGFSDDDVAFLITEFNRIAELDYPHVGKIFWVFASKVTKFNPAKYEKHPALFGVFRAMRNITRRLVLSYSYTGRFDEVKLSMIDNKDSKYSADHALGKLHAWFTGDDLGFYYTCQVIHNLMEKHFPFKEDEKFEAEVAAKREAMIASGEIPAPAVKPSVKEESLRQNKKSNTSKPRRTPSTRPGLGTLGSVFDGLDLKEPSNEQVNSDSSK